MVFLVDIAVLENDLLRLGVPHHPIPLRGLPRTWFVRLRVVGDSLNPILRKHLSHRHFERLFEILSELLHAILFRRSRCLNRLPELTNHAPGNPRELPGRDRRLHLLRPLAREEQLHPVRSPAIPRRHPVRPERDVDRVVELDSGGHPLLDTIPECRVGQRGAE